MNKKIEVLKKAIKSLENNEIIYNWNSTDSCNCGVILQSAGLKRIDIRGRVGGTYTDIVLKHEKISEPRCNITGMRFGQIQEKFLEIGFTKKEIVELEWLGNEEISKITHEKLVKSRIGDHKCSNNYNKKDSLITYLKAWVQLLENQEATKEEIKQELPKTIVRREIVKVDNSICKLAKELILN